MRLFNSVVTRTLFFLALALTSAVAANGAASAADNGKAGASDDAVLDFVVYMLEKPSEDVRKFAYGLIDVPNMKFIHLDKNFETPPPLPSVFTTYIKDVKKDYAPPPPQQLEYSSFGVNARAREAVQNSPGALLMRFSLHVSNGVDPMLEAEKTVEAVALKFGGLIWDEYTQELFSPMDWRARRIASWQEGVPAAKSQTAISASEKDGLLRMTTFGMQKFALPDICADNVPQPSAKRMEALISLVSQTLVEGGLPNDKGELALDINKLYHHGVKKEFASLMAGGNDKNAGRATIQLQLVEPQQGDAENYQYLLSFASQPGETPGQKQAHFLSGLFGK